MEQWARCSTPAEGWRTGCPRPGPSTAGQADLEEATLDGMKLSQQMFERGLTMDVHPRTRERDHYLRYGGFKSANDGMLGSRGAMLFEPRNDRPDEGLEPHRRDESLILSNTSSK